MSAAIRAARTSFAEVRQTPVWSMDTDQVNAALNDLAALDAESTVLRSRLLLQAEALEATESASTPIWLATRQNLTRPEAHRRTRLAHALGAHPLTEAAMLDRGVQGDQALAITTGVDALPDELGQEVKDRAEQHLIELAADHDAKALKSLARSILEVVAPDLADAHLAKQLERLERDAEDANRLRIWETPHGRVKGTFDLDGFSGACLTKALFATAAPKHRAAKGPLGERLPNAERLGSAFAEYVRRYPKKKLPHAGGLNATVVVLMEHKTMMGDVKAAKLDTGEHISAGLARRIMCEAGIIPAVLGGTSQVLDLGRTRRFHNTAQRIKATIEQGGCIEEGCDAPPAMTQMHHPEPFSQGGNTDGEGWMLCPSAHRRVHDPRYICERLPNGKVRFHRRT